MVPRNAKEDEMDEIVDVHDLIGAACRKLHLLDNLASDWETSYSNGLDADAKSDNGSDVSVGDLKSPLFNEASLQHFVIERKGYYHCSECSFQTNSYKTFCKHCAKFHPTLEASIRNGETNKIVYRCMKCNYLALNFRSFKTHCIGKHRCFPHAVLQTFFLNCPKAEFYFQQFTQTTESNRKKQAVKLLKYYFTNKQQNFDCLTEKREVVEEASFLSKNSEELECSICDYTNTFVYFLEKHYQVQHGRKGPERSLLDNLFHCKDCTFASSSYKDLHLHIFKIHQKKSSFSNSLQTNQLGNESNLVDYIPESPAPSIGCIDSDVTRALHCHLCPFTSTNISVILNHWRSYHNRDYPPFVNQYIDNDYRDNVVLVDLPLKMLGSGWMNGWINEQCTGLIRKPLFQCIFCTFSANIIKSMHHHYSSEHPSVSGCAAKLVVIETATDVREAKRRLCNESTMYQCSRCNEYTACFHKNLLDHYKANHAEVITEFNEVELDNEIRSRVVLRCYKCNDVYCHDPTALAQHYVTNHTIDAKTFSLKSGGTDFEAVCSFCDFSSGSLLQFTHHLSEHRSMQLADYKRRHVTAYGCSRCRRVFRHQRTLHQHHSRIHVDWNNACFDYKHFPPQFFTSTSVQAMNELKHETRSSSVAPSVVSDETCSDPIMMQHCPVIHQDNAIEKSADEASQSSNDSALIEPASFLCYLCRFSFKQPEQVQTHLKSEHGVTMSLKMLRERSSWVSKRKVFLTCSHQTYIDKRPITYQKHVESYHNEKEPFSCPHCHQSYICDVVLRMHIRKKHKSVTTSQENNVSSSRPVLLSCTHRNIEKRNPTLYASHIAQKHNEMKPYHCPRCSRVYVCKSIFLVHMQKKHQLQISDQRARRCQRLVSNRLSKTPPLTAMSLVKTASSEIEANHSKDYQQAKSIRTIEGQWRCLYCKVLFKSYPCLRRHCMKQHPNNRIQRCRWCDFICKTSAQLNNHNRIHTKFVAARMKLLRQICMRNRNVAASRGSSSVTPKLTDDVIEDAPPANSASSTPPNLTESPLGVDKARKTTKKVFFCRKTMPKARSDTSKPALTSRHFYITEHGAYRCRLCRFVSAEKSRLLRHLKSIHINRKLYKCKLCSFQHKMFEQIHAHLSGHHKMERNHQLAIEMSVLFGGETPKPETNDPPPEPHYVPTPSLPVAVSWGKEPDSDSDNDVPMKEEEPQEPGSLGSKPLESPDGLNFNCGYCEASLPSSYEAECHMVRHERCMVSATDIDESTLLFAKFTSFLQPL